MLGLYVRTLLKGILIGRDAYGNRYYCERQGRLLGGASGPPRRWVLYKGRQEASKVPAAWHAWLHSAVEEPPFETSSPQYPWQKPHQPNTTGASSGRQSPRKDASKRKQKPHYYDPWTPA